MMRAVLGAALGLSLVATGCGRGDDPEVTRRGGLCGDPGLAGSVSGYLPGEVAGCGVERAVRLEVVHGVRLSQPATLEYDDAPDVADPAPDPEARAALSGETRRIEGCLDELEKDKAAAVVAAYVEGLSYQELAEQFAVPLNTMRTWLRRSLIKLRECLNR